MKNIHNLFAALILVASSCVDLAYDEFHYTIFNETDKQVTVLGFYTKSVPYGRGRAEAILIGPGSNYTVTRINGIGNDTFMRFYSLKGGGLIR
ncbi:hypothetical protein DN752_03470 [Echinicola strongylocentroti]|uniref:Uncharacterized protein n=1 Tax=Echinicola strongylocentroti TaxID=1795355 RepID=A0A2Z4IEI9_9BACT|nr:hypothetical protein [Echinicola strongylocentroti]AWW29275.1 hypothetical protein DN752_03470 [Echinicola strongylocentroti]